MAWAVIRRSLTEKARVQSQANPCGICGWSSFHCETLLTDYFDFPPPVTLHRAQRLL